MTISVENAEHYVWGESCDGWHLLKRDDISVIQERVPVGDMEVMHYHNLARQFFYTLHGHKLRLFTLWEAQFPGTARQGRCETGALYILEGEGTMVFEDREMVLKKGQGLEIPPQV